MALCKQITRLRLLYDANAGVNAGANAAHVVYIYHCVRLRRCSLLHIILITYVGLKVELVYG